MKSESFANVWDAIEAAPEAAAEMKRRLGIMATLQERITSAGMNEPQAAKMLGADVVRALDLVHGKLSQFGLDELVHRAVAVGLTVSHEVLTPFDAAEWLTSDEAISAFLADAEDAGDADFIADAREVVEQARAINRSKKSKSHG
jgi:predicted XRE-type DNA-binding protein